MPYHLRCYYYQLRLVVSGEPSGLHVVRVIIKKRHPALDLLQQGIHDLVPEGFDTQPWVQSLQGHSDEFQNAPEDSKDTTIDTVELSSWFLAFNGPRKWIPVVILERIHHTTEELGQLVPDGIPGARSTFVHSQP